MSKIKERVLEVIKIKKFTKEHFFASIGMTSSNFRAKAKESPLNSDAIYKILRLVPDINPNWLITGCGSMLCNPYLEQSNWIIDDNTNKHISIKHSSDSLDRIGLRIDEIACKKYLRHDELSRVLGLECIDLVSMISGTEPVSTDVLQQILNVYPNINPIWLCLNRGRMFKSVLETNHSSNLELVKELIHKIEQQALEIGQLKERFKIE